MAEEVPQEVLDRCTVEQREMTLALAAHGLHRAPMMGEPQQGCVPWWLQGVAYMEFVVDSGAIDNSASSQAEGYMAASLPSMINMRSAEAAGGVL